MIIILQYYLSCKVENEYGSYFTCDHQYMSHLQALFEKYLGQDVILSTVDGYSDKMLECGSLPSLFTTVDFGPGIKVKRQLFSQIQVLHVTNHFVLPKLITNHFVLLWWSLPLLLHLILPGICHLMNPFFSTQCSQCFSQCFSFLHHILFSSFQGHFVPTST